MERNLLAERRTVEVGADKVLEFVVDFDGVHMRLGRKETFGEAKCGVAGESAEFEHIHGFNHAHQHFEQSSLQVSRTHARAQVVEMCLAVEATEFLGFAVDVAEYVVFELIVVGGHDARWVCSRDSGEII